MTPTARRAIVVATSIIVVATLVVLFIFDPMQAGFFPRCPSKMLTGYDCPGCGTLRALHALLHGDIAQVWDFNPALFFALPLAAIFFLGDSRSGPRWCRAVSHSRLTPPLLLAAIIAWTLARNL